MSNVIIENVGTPTDLVGLGKWVQRQTVLAADRAIKAEVAKGFDPQPVVITDGVVRKDYALVKPFGKIEFVRRTKLGDAVAWALARLIEIAPIGRGPDSRPGHPGFYKASFAVLINGVQAAGNVSVALKSLKPTDRVQIVNTAIYARKIEGATANSKTGRGARKPSSRQARSGVFRKVHRELIQRYSKSMFFDFTYVKLNTGAKVWGDQGGAYYNRLKKNGGGWVKHKVKRVLRDQVYPALKFFDKPTGLPN